MTNSSPIWIYYDNIATLEPLIDSETKVGMIGDSYHINPPFIENFVYEDSSSELTIHFNEQPQNIFLYYRPENWQEVHRISMFIEILSNTIAYYSPDDNRITVNVPAQSFWETPLRVISQDGQFWYQIDTHAWLRYDPVIMTILNQEPKTHVINYFKKQFIEPTQPNAVVDFIKNGSTDVFSEPYGLPISSLMDGDLVTIIGEQNNQNGLTWFKLANNGWINSLYIKKLKKDSL